MKLRTVTRRMPDARLNLDNGATYEVFQHLPRLFVSSTLMELVKKLFTIVDINAL